MEPHSPASAGPAWLDWGTEAFGLAHALNRPVLLAVMAGWSDACQALDRETFADAGVIACIERAFVPVRVDAACRPDIAERYTLGGWPTVAFLTPDGAVLGGGTWIDAAALRSTLDALAGEFSKRWPSLRGAGLPALRSRGDVEAGAHPPIAAEEVATSFSARLLATFDAVHGGFGPPPREAPATLLRAAIACWRRNDDPRLRHAVVRTLDATAWGGLWDAEQQAFLRGAASADWSSTDRAVLTEVQSAMLLALADAWTAFGYGRYLDRARDVVASMDRALLTLDGGFRAYPDSPHLFVDVNARAAGAWLAAAPALGEARVAERAIDVLERVAHAAYERNAGVAHYLERTRQGGWRPRIRGLLTDQVAVAETALAAHAAGAGPVYLDLGDELVRVAWRRLWDARAGGLLDRVRTAAGAGDVGLLGQSHVPEPLNADMARVLADLARQRSDPWSAEQATRLRQRAPDPAAAPLVDLAAWVLALDDTPGWAVGGSRGPEA